MIEHDSAAASFVMPLESPFGAFVVAFNGDRSVKVSIRDGSGDLMMSKGYEGRPFGQQRIGQ